MRAIFRRFWTCAKKCVSEGGPEKGVFLIQFKYLFHMVIGISKFGHISDYGFLGQDLRADFRVVDWRFGNEGRVGEIIEIGQKSEVGWKTG